MRSTRLFFILFFALVNSAFAESCWESAAQRYGVNATILHAIAMTESAMNVRALNRNSQRIGGCGFDADQFSVVSSPGRDGN